MGTLTISVLVFADAMAVYMFFVMMTYLTEVWGMSITNAAAIVNIWIGGCRMLIPILTFIVDYGLGHFWLLVISSVAYSIGSTFLSMSIPPILSKATGTYSDYQPQYIGNTHKGLLYTGLVLIGIGLGGHATSLIPFIEANSPNNSNSNNQKKEHRYHGFAITVLTIIAAVGFPLIQKWAIVFGIQAIGTIFVTIIFLSLSSSYDTKNQEQLSPLTTFFRVLVASLSKIHKRIPDKPDDEQYRKVDDPDTPLSNSLRCLNKAVIILPYQQGREEDNKWRLCSVQEVEETKVVISLMPLWITYIICGLVSSVGNTYFLEQGNNMDRKLGKIDIPVPCFLLFQELVVKKMIVKLFDKMKCGAIPRMGMLISMVFATLCCITASSVEKRRLKMIRKHDLPDGPDGDIPMTIFWLLPQFVLLAEVDSFFENSVARFFRTSFPLSWDKYSVPLGRGVSGLGIVSSAILVPIVGKISEQGGKSNWFQHTLNRSRLDKYFWTLSIICAVVCIIYSVLGCIYFCNTPMDETRQREYDAYLATHRYDSEDEQCCCCCCCCGGGDDDWLDKA